MKYTIRAYLSWLGRKIRAHFLAGILVSVPLGLTIWIFAWIFTGIDDFLQPIITQIFGRPVPGVGFGITVVLVYLIGVIASNVLGRRLLRYGESILEKVPVVRPIYTGIRQVLQSFSRPDKGGFMQVVLIEFPRRGIRTIGFVTNEESDESGKKLLNVFIPTCPNPTGGFLQIVEESEVIRTKISVDAALKMVVSGGRMSPKEVKDKLLAPSEEMHTPDSTPNAGDFPPTEDKMVTIKSGKKRKQHSSSGEDE